LEVVGVRGWQFAGKVCLLQQSQYGGWLLGQPEDSKNLAASPKSFNIITSFSWNFASTTGYLRELCNGF
jgi:hypothetical protein